MIVITDILRSPIDEGAKVATCQLLKRLKQNHDAVVLSVNGDKNFPDIDYHFNTNKLLLTAALYQCVKRQSSPNILYIPEASITPNSFLRAKLLQWFTGKEVHILSLQPRHYGRITKKLLPFLKPHSIITQSKTTARYLKKFSFKTSVLPLGVDETKFSPYEQSKKEELRLKHNIPVASTVILHVGHVRSSRNLGVFLDVKKQLPNVFPIIIGSTYSPLDDQINTDLTAAGIRVIREYIPKLEDFYNLADYYIFPVLKNDGAIETPLSVLEAMACNLPIISTRFGSLPDVFQEDSCFHFFDSAQDIVDVIKHGKPAHCPNREKIKPFTWDAITEQLVAAIIS